MRLLDHVVDGLFRLAVFMALAAIILLLAGCGSTTRTVERERFQVDGTAGGLPVQGIISRERTQTEETTVNAPEVGQTIGALSSLASAATPVGIGGGILGLAAAWWFRRKAVTAENKASWADDAFLKLHEALQDAKASLPDDETRRVVDHAVAAKLDRDEKQRIARAAALT